MKFRSSVAVQTCNPSTLETQAGGSEFEDSPGYIGRL
jgi:hypothetical protein